MMRILEKKKEGETINPGKPVKKTKQDKMNVASFDVRLDFCES